VILFIDIDHGEMKDSGLSSHFDNMGIDGVVGAFSVTAGEYRVCREICPWSWEVRPWVTVAPLTLEAVRLHLAQGVLFQFQWVREMVSEVRSA
jgi:hypothetical protein